MKIIFVQLIRGTKDFCFFVVVVQFRSVSSEVSSDLIIEVKGSRYLLHKVHTYYFSQK